MEILNINLENNNMEVLAKIANSMAKKYGCKIIFNANTKTIDFSGKVEFKSRIAQDTLKVFRNGI